MKAALVVEAKIIYPDHETSWYCLGKWSASDKHPRESVNGQEDEHGRVLTDTLKMKQAGGAVQLRIVFSDGASAADLDFLGLSFCDSKATSNALPPNQSAWRKALDVPKRSQADYPEGISEWCSPTSVSMVLAYWAETLHRPELNHSVPAVARAVHDPNWPGTGNWPFNTAFAGAHPGIRAYVTRLSDVSEIEDWTASGIPVIASVSYGVLKGAAQKGNGHLIVCVGFTKTGEVVVNDPGRKSVRQTYSRENFIRAWAESKNTVYLVYPEAVAIPADRFKHWFAPSKQIKAE